MTDTLFHSGHIITLDPQNPHPESVLVREGKIIATGLFHTLKKIATNPQLINLDGHTLLPALTDAHTHFVETARHQLTLNMIDCKNDADFYRRLVDYRETYQKMLYDFGYQSPLTWIKGYGWEKNVFDSYPSIDARLIDRVFPDIPVSIASRDLHSNLCNSKALDIIDIPKNQNMMKNMGIEIGRQSGGEANGYLYENAWTILEKFIPELDSELQSRLIKKLIKKCHRYGLCGTHSIENIHSAKLVHDISREATFYFTWYYLDLNPQKERNFDYLSLFLSQTSHFRNGGIKLFSDGSLGSDTAWLFPEHTIDVAYIENLISEIESAHQQGIQVAIHAIGDYAVYTIAQIIKDTISRYPSALRHRIEHLQAVRPQDMAIVRDSRTHASMQPVHMRTDVEAINKKWHTAKNHAFPLKSLQNITTLALGSDAPVETLNPFDGLRFATQRNGFLPHECISLHEALSSYAYTHHIVANQPITSGIIKPDMIANLIVVDGNQIKDLTQFGDSVLLTMIDGEIVFSMQ